MQTLMIHEFTPNMLDLDVSKFDTITYDDGLESQLYYRDIFPNKRKIFFICPHFIEQGHNGPGEKCMTLEDIKLLINEGFEIGAHSSSHTPLGHMENLAAQVSYMMHDTETCIDWFKKNLNITPTSFCFPYNDDCKDVYRAVVRKYGFIEFYGKERTPIERLLRN
jgi:peptidoglycan/xylan/chitin deacetylase (PgdA/CDA1 family)